MLGGATATPLVIQNRFVKVKSYRSGIRSEVFFFLQKVMNNMETSITINRGGHGWVYI